MSTREERHLDCPDAASLILHLQDEKSFLCQKDFEQQPGWDQFQEKAYSAQVIQSLTFQ